MNQSIYNKSKARIDNLNSNCNLFCKITTDQNNALNDLVLIKAASLQNLLKLSNNFEFKSALLLKLADNEGDGDGEVDYISAYSNSSFYIKLKSLVGINLSDREIDTWVLENSNIIDREFFYLNWLILGGRIMRARSSNNLSVTYEISKLKSASEGDILKESILTSVGRVPRLYIYSKDAYEKGIPNTTVDKNIAHDQFIIEAFEEIAKNKLEDLDSEFYELINEFYKKYHDNIIKIKKMFTKTPKILGSGSDGTAFDIGSGRVLKIFTNRTAYDSTIRSMDLLHSRPDIASTEVMVYDAGVFGVFDDIIIYYSIIEKTKTKELTPNIGAVDFAIKSIIESIDINMIRELKLLIDIKNDKAAKELANRITNDVCLIVENDYDFMTIIGRSGLYDVLDEDWIKSLVYGIVIKLATGRADLHSGNIGISNKELKYFDPSFDYRDAQWLQYLSNKNNKDIQMFKVFDDNLNTSIDDYIF